MRYHLLEPSSNEDNIFDLDTIYPNLRVLDLSNNKINWIPVLHSANLQILDLFRNKITSIHSKMFIGLTKVEFLGLTCNELKEINNNIGELLLYVYLYMVTNLRLLF